jgi:MFS family permease
MGMPGKITGRIAKPGYFIVAKSTSNRAYGQAREHYPKLGWIYDLITGEEDTRVCKDIPDAACRHQPYNFLAYLFANFLGKVADELSSARLVLPWLLGALGAPAVFVGFLVPIREAGVLLPQLAVAAYIRRLQKRKVVWLLGAMLSSVALICMAIGTTASGATTAGWTVLVTLVLFSLARGLCSVSAKDVLGKTVSKTRRGALMGYSAAAAGLVTLLIGGYIEFIAERRPDASFFMVMLLAAAFLWLVATAVFASIREEPGATRGGGNALTAALQSLALLKTDSDFRHYVIARSLLLSTALALPFYVLLAQQNSAGITGLGLLIVASGLAAGLSAPVWGRKGDRSSRGVMVFASTAAGLTGLVTWLLDNANAPVMESPWIYAFLFLMIAVFHSGMRLGRKVYLVDMASQETRSTYVAVSNTVIGTAMLAGGMVGVLADLFRTSTVIALLGVVSLLAAVYIRKMPDISG